MLKDAHLVVKPRLLPHHLEAINSNRLSSLHPCRCCTTVNTAGHVFIISYIQDTVTLTDSESKLIHSYPDVSGSIFAPVKSRIFHPHHRHFEVIQTLAMIASTPGCDIRNSVEMRKTSLKKLQASFEALSFRRIC